MSSPPSRAFGIAWKALLFGAAPVLLVAWCNRPLDPDAWRTFARTATDAELQEQLPSDAGGREREERWKQYLRALARGDDEAIRVAGRVCRKLDGHVSSQFLDALSWNLERTPARVFELERQCPLAGLACEPLFDDDYLDQPRDPSLATESFETRREAVRAFLDGGWSAEASACLDKLRE